MISMMQMVAGIGWEPEIRGLLTVVLAWAILGGALANTFGYVAVFQGCAVVATLWLIGWLRRRAAA